SLGKFEGKVDEGFLVGYSVNSKASRAFNSRSCIVQETLHVNFIEKKPNITEKSGEEIDQQYVLFLAWSSGSTIPHNYNRDVSFDGKEYDFDVKKPKSEVILSLSSSAYSNEVNATGTIVPTVRQNSVNNTNTFSAAGPPNVVASPTYGKSLFINASQLFDDPDMLKLEDIIYSDEDNNVGVEADFNNLETSITVRVNTPRSDEDRLELMELMVFLLPTVEKVRIRVNAIDLKVSAVRHMLLLLVQKFLLFSLTNGCCSLVLLGYDVTRLQALVDKKRVIVTEAAIREKVFANMRRVGKGFSRVDTPLFEGMLVAQEIEEEGDADEHVVDVTAGDAAHRDDSAAHGEVPTHLEYDKVAQALEITKLKKMVKKLEKGNKVRVLKLRRLQKVRTSQRVDTSDDTVIDDESNKGRMIAKIDKDDAVVLTDDKEEDKKVEEAKVVESAQEEEIEPSEVQEVVDVVITAKLITKVVTAASETVTTASAIIHTVEPQVPAATLSAAPVRVAAAPSRRRKGVVIRDPEEESTTSTIIPKTRSKDKGKWILVEEPKPLKKKQQIEMDEEYARKLHAELNKDIDWDVAIEHVKLKAKEDPAIKRYQAMKRKPQTEAQARKNMMMYLKNVVGFKLDYFKGMSYDDIRPIFEANFNSNVDFLLNTKEQIEEEENKTLQTINETLAEKAAKKRKLNEEVEDLKRHVEIVPDEDDDVYTKATPLARKLILLIERRYPLLQFTLDQMLNVVRLQVEEESKASLELLRFTRQQHQEGQLQ
nr:retrovirus-related Pol polyprotein from transposon TNT 1-94 [Tanacetum cinerariifolium]